MKYLKARVENVDMKALFAALPLQFSATSKKNQQKYSLNYFISFLKLSRLFTAPQLSNYKPRTLDNMVEEKETMKKVN